MVSLSSVINIQNIKDTVLWKKLNLGFQENDKDRSIANTLANNLEQICQQSYERVKYFSSLHPQFTLHDETHFLRVTELMAMIMPDDVLNNLNPIELALLILSAHFHDQGMVLDEKELKALEEDAVFILFKENWTIEHPNYKDIKNHITLPSNNEDERYRLVQKEQELYGALLTDYIRITHGIRSSDYVLNNYSNNDLWNIVGTNLADYVAKLCQSHVLPAAEINSQNGYYHDESIGGYQVNIIYLAIILRLADILDFDRDRTPDVLYKTIHFSNEVSLVEWAKHRSVEGWIINPKQIRFTLICEHPVYEKAVRQFIDWIDHELSEANTIIKQFPKEVQSYQLTLPQNVDRSRISAKNNSYIYHDLEFSLSRNEIVKLLMTDNLYKSASLCIRELLQNSLDALRHRQALMMRDNGVKWSLGKVHFNHTLDEHNREIIECVDNGIGMDMDIIVRFLTKAGRSYYRSPEFDQERTSFVKHGVDFDPCAQFGIGFMSCFMLGDEIIIKTRKDYGPFKGYGPPLIIEINGLGGLIVIRNGELSQEVGTSIKIIGRQKPEYFDMWEDKVRLIDVIDGYALATEFPISGNCMIPEIKDSIEVPINISKHKTQVENLSTNHITFEQDFNEINENLHGHVRTSFLLDKENKIALKNQDASWKKDGNGSLSLISNNNNIDSHFIHENYLSSTCIDGILVCGTPGRSRIRSRSRLGWYSNAISLGIDSFNIDIRGNLKPPLTTERIPPDNLIHLEESKKYKWDRVQKLASIAHGCLWEKVINHLYDESNDGDIFWKLAFIHRPDLFSIPYNTLFNKVYFPIVDNNRDLVRWAKANEIGYVEIRNKDNSFDLQLEDGNFIDEYTDLIEIKDRYNNLDMGLTMKKLIISMSILMKNESGLFFEIREPSILEKAPFQKWDKRSTPIIQYSSKLSGIIACTLPSKTINANHPLTEILVQTNDLIELSPLQTFIRSLFFSNIIRDLKAPDQNRWKRRVGFYYKAIDWNNVNESLKPPYKFLVSNNEEIEITEEELISWNEIPPQIL